MKFHYHVSPKAEAILQKYLNPSKARQSIDETTFFILLLFLKESLSVGLVGFKNTNSLTLPDEGHLLTPSQAGLLGESAQPSSVLHYAASEFVNTTGELPQLVLPVLIVWVFSFTSLEGFYKPLPGWSDVTVFFLGKQKIPTRGGPSFHEAPP